MAQTPAWVSLAGFADTSHSVDEVTCDTLQQPLALSLGQSPLGHLRDVEMMQRLRSDCFAILRWINCVHCLRPQFVS